MSDLVFAHPVMFRFVLVEEGEPGGGKLGYSGLLARCSLGMRGNA
jgi:hypothetical protein